MSRNPPSLLKAHLEHESSTLVGDMKKSKPDIALNMHTVVETPLFFGGHLENSTIGRWSTGLLGWRKQAKLVLSPMLVAGELFHHMWH